MDAPFGLVIASRAAHLLVLAIVPKSLSPEPVAPDGLGVHVGLSVAALAAIALGAEAFRRAMSGYRGATAAAVLAWATLPSAIVCAAVFSGSRAPLARAVFFVAPLVWGTLAATACALADRWLGSTFKHKRSAAITVVLAVGMKLLLGEASYLASNERMWTAALRKDGRNARALDELARPLLAHERYDDARRLGERCLALHPGSQPCRDLVDQAQARTKP